MQVAPSTQAFPTMNIRSAFTYRHAPLVKYLPRGRCCFCLLSSAEFSSIIFFSCTKKCSVRAISECLFSCSPAHSSPFMCENPTLTDFPWLIIAAYSCPSTTPLFNANANIRSETKNEKNATTRLGRSTYYRGSKEMRVGVN